MVRAEGVVRIRDLDLPTLRRAAALVSRDITDAWPVEVENLLREAVSRLGGGHLQTAAAYSLGLAPGMRDMAAGDRRRRAAKVYDLSVERFRKSQEEMILGQVAEQVCWLTETWVHGASGSGTPLLSPHLQHQALRLGALSVTLHLHPVELLRDIDVIVSPSNTHLGLPEMYKASVAASLRRAAAGRDATGHAVDDPVYDALLGWRRENGALGRPVQPGTIAPTGSGALAARGVRRIYHAAVAVPRPGTSDYDVNPQDVVTAVGAALALMDRERGEFTPPLRSICFPLLGSGRGGLSTHASVSALWTALAAGAGAEPAVHLVVRRARQADVVREALGGGHGQPPGMTALPEQVQRGLRCG
ncbi:hypothetical protein ACFVIM_23150 [Streptomyces sp. NPDC057638]|uniref:hypothetical protein n=1 Tax=Streptomyces sp. NPDC057638 TaxID=3346190 RepID=UPI0036A08941